MSNETTEHRAAAARHAAGAPVNRNGRLRSSKGFCFGGALCDYAASQPDYGGRWDRDPSGQWQFMDEAGRPHEQHVPIDVRRYLGLTDAEIATIIAAQEDRRMNEQEIGQKVIEGSLAPRSAEETAQQPQRAEALR